MICAFVFAYANCWFSDAAAHIYREKYPFIISKYTPYLAFCIGDLVHLEREITYIKLFFLDMIEVKNVRFLRNTEYRKQGLQEISPSIEIL